MTGFIRTPLHIAISVLLSVGAVAACMVNAQAQILTIDDVNNNLGTVNIGTGAVAINGNMGTDVMTDIAYSPTGILYGTSFRRLYEINPATGHATLIGSTGLSGGNALVFGSDGTLYLASENDDRLFTVNLQTGVASALGTTGFYSAGDLAFDDGSLYMSSTSSDLVRINLSGHVSATDIGPFGFSDVFGLATASNGVLYGVSGTQIFAVNTTTGHGTPVGDYSGHGLGGANGTSFYSEATPEPGSLLTLFAAGLVGGAIFRRRRQQH